MYVTDSDFLARVDATQRRYEQRAPERVETERVLRERGILYADTPERVDARLRRLGVDWGMARALERTPPGPSRPSSLADAVAPELLGSDVLGLERLMGRNNLIDVAFLEAGSRAGRSVGRVTVRRSGKRGTGFLISPRLLMTNNHVLGSAEEAAQAVVEFNYQDGPDRTPLTPLAFDLEPQSFFATQRTLDFSVVAVAPAGTGAAPLAQFGWLRLIEAEGKVIKGETVNIIQHPNGEPKQLALRENRVVDLLELFLHYETDTAPGSSGAPVLNDEWEVVALHHSGVPQRDADRNLIAVDGTRWTPDMGEDRLAWVANEGARISRVLRALREVGRTGATALDLNAELSLAAAAAPAPECAPAATLAPRFGTELLSDGSARFTVPVQMTVGLGTAAAAAFGATPPATPQPTMPPAPAVQHSREFRAALVNLEAGRNRVYYDEDADAEARERYYAPIDADQGDGQALFAALAALLSATHVPKPHYDPKAMVYPWVDQHPDRRLRSIYSGKVVDPKDFIREDVAIEIERSARIQELAASEATSGAVALEAAIETLEAQMPFNCEHVVPQSWFAKREPMKGDLHHLFACESDCNSFRGNFPYRDFADFEEVIRSDCGRREADGFEPASGKGPIARATLYFLLRYPAMIGDEARELQRERLPLLLDWHAKDPVGEYERHRNAAAAELQGNRNPLIDHPEWAGAIPFASAFGLV
jgi:endonuclease I/V8-like Glu-specific endopeptidase